MDSQHYSLELFIAKVLRFGVLLSGCFLLAGWILNFHFNGDAFSPLMTYHELSLPSQVQSAWAHSNIGLLISYVGLVLLIILPLTRVLLTIVLFCRSREWIMALVAGFVSIALILSFCLGFTE